jgi:hypothetical protein
MLPIDVMLKDSSQPAMGSFYEEVNSKLST